MLVGYARFDLYQPTYPVPTSTSLILPTHWPSECTYFLETPFRISAFVYFRYDLTPFLLHFRHSTLLIGLKTNVCQMICFIFPGWCKETYIGEILFRTDINWLPHITNVAIENRCSIVISGWQTFGKCKMDRYVGVL